MKYECELIQDLIPIVKDGIASKKSSDVVLAHIADCSVCREAFEMDTHVFIAPLKESDQTEIFKVTDYKNRIKKRRKSITLLTALFSVVLVVATIFATSQMVKLLEGESYSTRSISDYGNYAGHIEAEKEGFFSLLEIFPAEIPPSAKIEDYYYFCNNGLIDNSYQIYLLCSYEKNDFNNEKERLEAIELTFKDEVHKPIITDTGFNYTAIVTIFGDQNSFEYALINEDANTIVYVFAQSMGIDKSVVPSEYCPQGFEPPEEALSGLGSYNMYHFRVDDPMGGEIYVMPEIDAID